LLIHNKVCYRHTTRCRVDLIRTPHDGVFILQGHRRREHRVARKIGQKISVRDENVCDLSRNRQKNMWRVVYAKLWTFHCLLQKMRSRARSISPHIRQIDLDVNRTYRNHVMFRDRYGIKYVRMLFCFVPLLQASCSFVPYVSIAGTIHVQVEIFRLICSRL